MKRFSRFPLFFALFFIINLQHLFALSIPNRPRTYVSDYASILSPGTRQNLENGLHQFEEKTSNQVLVVTFPGLDGDSLERFSIKLAEAWKPGQKDKNNGVILLIFKNDRKVRIEVGYGLEGVLTDAVSSSIIQNEIVPNFRAGNYDEGIERAVAAILEATQGEYQPAPKTETDSKAVLFFILFLLFLYIRYAGAAGILFSSSGYYSRRGGGWGGGFGGGSGGGFSGGGGGFGGGGSSGSW